MKHPHQPSKPLKPENSTARIVHRIHTAALELKKSSEFSEQITEILTQIKDAGITFDQFSVYLMEEGAQRATHYHLGELPIGWSDIALYKEAAERDVFEKQQPKIWKDPVSKRSLWFLSVPSLRSAITLSSYRARRFTAKEKRLLVRLAMPLEQLIIRHRDLRELEMANARLLATDKDLLALHDGSYDLSGEDPDEVMQKIIGLAINKLQFDRAGIFLKDEQHDLLRGAWGVNEEIAVVPIPNTIFPLNPKNKCTISEAALIALGKRPYFLTQDLDGEGRHSVEGDIEANASVPMRVGHRIIGVLAVDNYFTHRPIFEHQIRPLMILANQGAVALENARLYHALQHAHDELDAKVEERTAQLGRALQDKEILLREVSHRIKNNLQVIDALLSLQLDGIVDDQVRLKMQDSRDRVHSMMILHDALHQSNDLRTIGLNDYLHRLAADIFDSYRLDDDTITLKTKIDDITLNVDKAIPCGLILNELISNALKYAFPESRAGTISLEATANTENDVVLILEDNGVGIPTDIDIQSVKTMGMQIVRMLVQQLQGHMTLHRNEGSKFVITFPRSDGVSFDN